MFHNNNIIIINHENFFVKTFTDINMEIKLCALLTIIYYAINNTTAVQSITAPLYMYMHIINRAYSQRQLSCIKSTHDNA